MFAQFNLRQDFTCLLFFWGAKVNLDYRFRYEVKREMKPSASESLV
jgi:hypothetical protein